MASTALAIADLKSCAYQNYPCNYNNMVTGTGMPIPGTRWYKGFSMIKDAKLYVGGLSKKDEWWKSGPPQGTDSRPGPFFTTVIKRAESFKGYVLEYSVLADTPLIYTANAGGFEVQEEVFKKGYIGYFSCKECEVSVTNAAAANFVDWKNVRDITSQVFS
jgi:hypothetical protein